MSKKILLYSIFFVVIVIATSLFSIPITFGTERDKTDITKSVTTVTEMNILWAQWDPANFLQEIGNMYTAQTGIKVNIIQEPWATFADSFFSAMSLHSTAWDMVIGDSQWLGQCTSEGNYVDLTGFLINENIKETVTEATLTYYGEYPTGSGQYWAYPTEGDAVGWAYRKDLFENENEKTAFQTRYGYPLDVPSTYTQLKDIAMFFTRPAMDLYGLAIYTQKDYDAITMGFESVLFSWGARWQDPQTNEVIGIINSPKAVEAAQFYKTLYDSCQVPGLENAFFVETNDALIAGRAALIMNYFAFFPALIDSTTNPFAHVTGFFANPAGPYGDRHTALGGQGISIISYISPERQQAAKDFIKWFAKEDIQAKWAELGGFTCNKNVLQSYTFLGATPFNPAFAQSMEFVMDFWNIPQYNLLLDVSQQELHSFVVEDSGTAKATMDSIAVKHDKILNLLGFIDTEVETIEKIFTTFSLYQNYPNPFNLGSTISYSLPRDSYVKVSVYNVTGQLMEILVDTQQSAGNYNVNWRADGYPSGLYVYRMETNGSTIMKKMLLLK